VPRQLIDPDTASCVVISVDLLRASLIRNEQAAAQFWFESMRNWLSEFIAAAAIVGVSNFLRQKGSAESKPVAEPHRHTSG
jgi:hypothetical protein